MIASNGAITVENGKVTFGRPSVTEEVEKRIYKTLNYYRNLAREIEEMVPGGNRGSQQTRQDYEFAKRNFMVQYDLSEEEIAAILKKGENRGWK